MKVSIALQLVLALLGSFAFADDDRVEQFNVVGLSADGVSDYDLSGSDLTLQITTQPAGKSFVLKSKCRSVSGNLIAAADPIQKDGYLEVQVTNLRDNCAGGEVDLLNLRAFVRFGMAQQLVQTEQGIRLITENGKGVEAKSLTQAVAANAK